MSREALSFGKKGADRLQTLRFAAPPHTHPIRTTRGKLCPPQDGQLNRASIMVDGKQTEYDVGEREKKVDVS